MNEAEGGGFSSFSSRLPLARWQSLTSADLDEVHRHMEVAIHPHELDIDERATIAFRHNRARLGSLSLNAISYGQSNGRIRIGIPPMRNHYMMQVSLGGSMRVDERGTSFEAAAGQIFVIRPEQEHVQYLAPGYRHLNLSIPRCLLERIVAQECGIEPALPIGFERVGLRDEPARSLWRLLWTVCRDFDQQSGVFSYSHVSRAIEEALVRTLLAAIPHSYSERLNAPCSPAAPYYVRRAEDFIRANLCEEIELFDIVAAAGVSTRCLQAGFRSYRDTTPLAYLKARRLERARTLLQTARETGQSVTDVAFSCGFSHLSKFARDYHQRFGENPSQTRNGFRSQ